ncbi:MAG TPA: NADH:flavin oxidoreductase [Vicinamibacteria bacterium]|nr:NADH:flavin oxidoreductase [Vicinamibacteria bacterium]
MWTPPERIRHPLPNARWPTAEEAATSIWFSPIRVGPMELRRRSWVPAMVPWRATEEGFVTDAILDWYERFARGKPGAIVVEATGVRDIPSGPLLRIGHDRFVPGLERLVDTVRRASEGETRLLIQIIDFLMIRRRPPKDRFFRSYLALRPEHRESLARVLRSQRWLSAPESEVREALSEREDILDDRELEALRFGARERVTDVHLPHIRDLPRVLPGIFADAAERAQRAGFDGVELHYAHAYTMASFLSRKNDRVDGYGGSLSNRVRLPLEVYGEVRKRVGTAYVVGCRMLGDEVIGGGSELEDARFFAVRFAEAGMDYLSISKGGKFEDAKQPDVGWAAYPYTGRSGYECMPTVYSDERGPFGRNTPLAAAIRRALREAGHRTPVVTSGGIGTFELAESILQRGEADIVAAARQSLADPDWFEKIRLGRGAEVRRCEFTNYCEALDQKHKEVTCKLWDRLDRDEPGVPLDRSGKRRLVAPKWELGRKSST